MEQVVLDGNSLSIEQVCAVARRGAKVSISPKTRQRVQRSREVIERAVAEGAAIYGVTTGIGEFARIRISPDQSAELQRRIVYSHSAGTGDPQPEDVVPLINEKAFLGTSGDLSPLAQFAEVAIGESACVGYWDIANSET